MTRLLAGAALLALASCQPAVAQTYQRAPIFQDRNGATQGAAGVFEVADDGTSSRETFRVVSANVAAPATTVFGGTYVLAQACSSYGLGSLSLQVLGPDGSAYLPLTTKTASDAGAGTGIQLGARAIVRAAITGTTGCNAVLARVPA